MKPSEFEHPDGSALIQTRRWVFVLGTSIAYLISLLLGLTGWRLMTSAEHALIVFSIPWFVLGLLMNRAGTRLWLFAPALASLVLCCVVAPRSHPQWIARVLLVSSGGPISTAVGHVLGTSPATTIELNLRIRNSALTEFAFNPKRHALVSFNTLPHLDKPEDEALVSYA